MQKTLDFVLLVEAQHREVFGILEDGTVRVEGKVKFTDEELRKVCVKLWKENMLLCAIWYKLTHWGKG